VRKFTALFAMMIAVTFALAACSKSSQDTSSSSSSDAGSQTSMAASSAPAEMANENEGGAKLPIPLAKLPSMTVAAGNASAGAQVFAANCASCHGEGGKNGTVGPTLAGAGLKAGQVAYMVRNPQGVDKDSSMPKLTLSDKQVADVAAYVASLK
jgi:mono/diheme cytochrome c family protein